MNDKASSLGLEEPPPHGGQKRPAPARKVLEPKNIACWIGKSQENKIIMHLHGLKRQKLDRAGQTKLEMVLRERVH